MKKLLLLVALFSMALGVQARKVAFRVDMTGQTVSANGVISPVTSKTLIMLVLTRTQT